MKLKYLVDLLSTLIGRIIGEMCEANNNNRLSEDDQVNNNAGTGLHHDGGGSLFSCNRQH